MVLLLALTVVVFLVEVVPLEVQRRIVNDAVKHRTLHFILVLCAACARVALAHGLLKMALNIYRGWVAQHVTRDLRKHVRELGVGRTRNAKSQERGIEISMIVAEAEPIGLFVAGALSEPLLEGRRGRRHRAPGCRDPGDSRRRSFGRGRGQASQARQPRLLRFGKG